MKNYRISILFFVLMVSQTYHAAYAQKLKILPLGNSITYDHNSLDESPFYNRSLSERLSYRYKLYQHLNATGYTWDYVGNWHCGYPSLPHNENNIDSIDYSENGGFPGITPQQMVEVLNTGMHYEVGCVIEYHLGSCNQPVANQFEYFQAYKPDVILLHLGTNGLESYENALSHLGYLETILNIIDQYENYSGKKITVFLAQIINRQSTSGNPEHVPTTQYNSLLSTLVSNWPTDKVKVVLVNMETGADIDYRNSGSGGDMIDTWHPAPSGYEKMGDKWFAALESVNLQAPVLSIPNIDFNETQVSAIIDLSPYVFDAQDADDEMIWSITGASIYYNISINNGILTITPKNQEESSVETITFKVRDKTHGGIFYEDTDNVTIGYTAVNDKPVIIETTHLYTTQNKSVVISLDDLLVEDPDNVYPDDFTLKIENGSHYTVDGNTVIPENNYIGTLNVPVKVNDGSIDSDPETVAISVGVSDIGQPEVSESPIKNIYPNPAKTLLFVEFNKNVECSFQLMDITGKVMLIAEHGSNLPVETISLQSFAPGVYFIKIIHYDGVYTEKFIVQ